MLISAAKESCRYYLNKINRPHSDIDGYIEDFDRGSKRAFVFENIFTHCSSRFSLFAVSALISNHYTEFYSRLQNNVIAQIKASFKDKMPNLKRLVMRIFKLDDDDWDKRVKELMARVDGFSNVCATDSCPAQLDEEKHQDFWIKKIMTIENDFLEIFNPQIILSRLIESSKLWKEHPSEVAWISSIYTHCSIGFSMFAWHTLLYKKYIQCGGLCLDIEKFVIQQFLRKDDDLEWMKKAFRDHVKSFNEATKNLNYEISKDDVQMLENNLRIMAKELEEKNCDKASRNESCIVM